MADNPSGEDRSKRASDVRHLGGEANWSRRYRANLDRLDSGDRGQVAAVVDGLSQRDRDYGLSQGGNDGCLTGPGNSFRTRLATDRPACASHGHRSRPPARAASLLPSQQTPTGPDLPASLVGPGSALGAILGALQVSPPAGHAAGCSPSPAADRDVACDLTQA